MEYRNYFSVRLSLLIITILSLNSFSSFGESASSPFFSVGSTVFFGKYEQDNNFENGTEPIEWLILDKHSENVLLLSRYVIDCKPYNDENGETNWNSSSIRSWLNGEFLDIAFSEAEKKTIIETSVSNSISDQPQNDKWSPTSCGKTIDRVYLLSCQEYAKYLGDEFVTDGTTYANKHNAKGVFWDAKATQLTRSSGKNAKEVSYLYVYLTPNSTYATIEHGIRPALWINTSKYDWEHNSYYMSRQSEILAEQGQYSEAIAIADSLENYNDSLSKSIAYRVMAGNVEYDKKEFKEAIEWYERAKEMIKENYDKKTADKLIKEYNINPQLLEGRYQLAQQYIEEKNYEGAIKELTIIGQYQDSMYLLMDCYTKCHIQFSPIIYAKESAIDTGFNNGFSGNNKIIQGNPHFGLNLGYFMMSGYTERKDTADGPVFIKTPGDNLILWFVLTDDLDALKGDKNIFVVNIEKGADVEFGIENKKFGRGTLLIKHIEADNWVNIDTPYTDYLAAHEDTGANTKYEINEEGTYEIALDYRIGAKKKVVLMPKTDYHDYRLRFSFKVQNGSGMFFLYDLNSGSEIQDYSRIEDGFRVDLKHSHALSIYVKRYELNQIGTGLDVRNPVIASDGSEFDTIGYYEITVTNKSTGREMTKHLFIGNTNDLEEYKLTGDSRLLSFR